MPHVFFILATTDTQLQNIGDRIVAGLEKSGMCACVQDEGFIGYRLYTGILQVRRRKLDDLLEPLL